MAGVNQITQFLAREWAPQQVRVNAIVPGFFPAERVASIMTHTPMARFGEAEELVASRKASSRVTGLIVRV